MEFFYAVRTRTLFVSRDISTGRPCERRDPYGEDSRFGAGAEAFFSFEARGYGSLRSQGRPAESLCETTIASTRGSIRSYAIPLPLAGRGRNSHGEFRVRGSRSGRSRRKRDPSTVMPGLTNFAVLAAEFPAAAHAAPRLMPLMSAVAHVRSVCVRAGNASLPTGRFAAAR